MELPNPDSMKRAIFILFVALFATLGASAESYRVEDVPNVQLRDSRRYVSNPDGILDNVTVMRIDTLCANLRSEGLAQVAVVAVDDIEGGDAFSFAIALFREWGVGREDVNNGLGVLLVKDLREIRFVTGGGLEGVLTDALSKRIQMQAMLPFFREGDYDGGMMAGMAAVAEILRGGELGFGAEEDDLQGIVPMLGLFVMVMLLLVVVIYVRSKRCPKCGRMALRQTASNVVSVTRSYRIIETTHVCSRCGNIVRRRVRNQRNTHIGGGGPFIGGMGGFGGGGGSFGGGSFGGGSFGGGGAGSRW